MNQETETQSSAEEAQLDRIKVGISSCLLGQEVRFDGGHKRNSYITGTLSDYFDFVPFCPEEGAGLGIPRQPIRLVRRGGEIRAVGVKTPELDPTDDLEAFARDTVPQLGDLSGIS